MLSEMLFKDQDSITNKIINLEHQSQINLNARLDKMRFNDYTESEFNSTKPHKSDEVSFVTNSSGDVSLYKGDVLLSGKGGDLSVTYAYVTDKDRGKGHIEQRTGYRNHRGVFSQNDVYTGPNGDRKLGNVIFNGLQIGLDSKINVETMSDGYSIQAPAFAGGLCPYISFNIERTHKVTKPNGTTVTTSRVETLEYWLHLDGIRGLSSIVTLEKTGKVVPDRYVYYYIIKGRRTIKTTQPVVQEFDILCSSYGENSPFESRVFNYKVIGNGDNAVSWNGLRLACSDIKRTKTYNGDVGEIINPVLSVNFTDILSGMLISENPYILTTSYLLESEKRPFGLRFDPKTGEKLEPPILRFSNNNEKILAYIVSFKDGEEVKV